MDSKLDGLMIYKQYIELLSYMEMITEKYPSKEKNNIVLRIKNLSYDGIELIIRANKEYNRNKRIDLLFDIDTKLKMINLMIRLSYKKKYINRKNYYAWCKKIANINNLLYGWLKSCQKQ